MALAKKCDRCGKFYDLKGINICGAIVNGLKIIGRDEQNNQIIKNIYFDLCPECLVSLAGWLKNKPMTFNEIRHAAGLEPIKENYEAFIQLYSEKGE